MGIKSVTVQTLGCMHLEFPLKLLQFSIQYIIWGTWILLPGPAKGFSQAVEPLLADITFTNFPSTNYHAFSFAAPGDNESGSRLKGANNQAYWVTNCGLASLLIAPENGKVVVNGDNIDLQIPIDFTTSRLFIGAGLYDPLSRKVGGSRIRGALYVSYLFRSLAHNHNRAFSGIYFARQNSGKDGMLIGVFGQNQTTGLRDAATLAGVDLRNFGGTGEYNVADHATHLMMLKFTYQPGVSNAITAWLDPDPKAGEANQNSPATFWGSLIGDGGFDRLFLHGGSNSPMDFGEIRFGTTWDAVLPPNHSPQCFPEHDFAAWTDFFAAHLRTNATQGYTFIALDHGKITASASGGYCRAQSGRGVATPWNTQQMLHVASVSKTITATAIMKLWEERRCSLDEPFWPYLSDIFPQASANSKAISIRQLLVHRSGLTQNAVDIKSTARLLASLSNELPGFRSYYNNLNYYILRLLIEKISGEPYTQYVQNHVLRPAGISSMDTKSKAPDGWDATAFAGAIGWHATVADLAAVLNGLNQGKILAPISVEKMYHEALGWNPITLDGQIIGYHKNGRWQADDGDGEAAEIAHFVDGVDVSLLINLPVRSQARLLATAWQLDKSGRFKGWTTSSGF